MTGRGAVGSVNPGKPGRTRMVTKRFGKVVPLPSTVAIKDQIRKMGERDAALSD